METFVTLGIALGLGLLIGLQRERSESRFGGIRTFPLISLFGAFCGLLGARHGAWPIVAGIVAVFGTLVTFNLLDRGRSEGEHGQTTEIAALLTFVIGAYLPGGDPAVAALAAGLIVVLLHLKEPMHVFVQRMGPKDMTALMQLVVIALIILPLLPDREMGPLGVLNPFDIWRMVVLIVGLGMAGYIAYKLVGATAGVVLGGILGGLISSTATTVSYARRVREAPGTHLLAIAVILIASAVSHGRILIEVSLFAPSHLAALLPPLLAALGWMGAIAIVAFLRFHGERQEMAPAANPAELKSALVFGLIYAGVTLAVAFVKERFGAGGLYVVAVVSGLTDMDAITLSLSRMVEGGQLPAHHAWRLILAASLANFLFKGLAAAFLGGRKLGLRLAPFVGAALAGGLALMWLWPENAPGGAAAPR